MITNNLRNSLIKSTHQFKSIYPKCCFIIRSFSNDVGTSSEGGEGEIFKLFERNQLKNIEKLDGFVNKQNEIQKKIHKSFVPEQEKKNYNQNLKYSNINYKEMEQSGKIEQYFNSKSKYHGNTKTNNLLSFSLELSYYLSNTKNKEVVESLYKNLKGTVKCNVHVLNCFLKFFSAKSNNNNNDGTINSTSNQELFKLATQSIQIEDWNTDTWYYVLSNMIETENQSRLIDQFIFNMNGKKVKYDNRIKETLANYYISKGDYVQATFYIKLLCVNVDKVAVEPDTTTTSGTGEEITKEIKTFPFNSLNRFVDTLINVNSLAVIVLVKFLIRKIGATLTQDIKFIQIIHSFEKAKKTEELLDVWSSVEESPDTSIVNYNLMIEYYSLVSCDVRMANMFLEKAVKKFEANISTLEPLLKLCFLKNEDEFVIKKIMKSFNLLNVEFNTPIFYHLIKKLSTPSDKDKLLNRLIIRNSEKFANILIYSDKIGDTEMTTLLLDALTKCNSIDLCTSHVIEQYLLLDEFQKALQWFTSRTTAFNLKPSRNVFLSFIAYHKFKGETDLSLHWYDNMTKIHKNNQETKQKEFEIKTKFRSQFKNDKFLTDISNWLEPSSMKNFISEIDSTPTSSFSILSKQLIQKQIKFANYQRDKEIETILSSIATYGIRNDITQLKIQLLNCIADNYYPSQELLTKILDTIYLGDPSTFLSFTSSIKNNNSSISFFSQVYSTVVKFDIEFGLIQMNNDFDVRSFSTSLWSATIINLVRCGNFKLAFRLIQNMDENNKQLTPQALYLLGLEISNVRYKINQIPFNYNLNLNLNFYKKSDSSTSSSSSSSLNNQDHDDDFNNEEQQQTQQIVESNYYLNNLSIEDTNELYTLIKNYKIILFSIYQKIQNGIESNSSGSGNDTEEELNKSIAYNFYNTPIINSCISILIDIGDYQNSFLLLDRLIESGLCNRESLLLMVEAYRSSNTISDKEQLTKLFVKHCSKYSKQLFLTPIEIYQLSENTQCFKDHSFIKQFLETPPKHQLLELFNQKKSLSFITPISNSHELSIIEMLNNVNDKNKK